MQVISIFNTYIFGLPILYVAGNEGQKMEHAEENMMDPFNIGLFLIEAGLVGVVIYAMMVLPALFKPMI